MIINEKTVKAMSKTELEHVILMYTKYWHAKDDVFNKIYQLYKELKRREQDEYLRKAGGRES